MSRRLGKQERKTVALVAAMLKRLELAAEAQEDRGNRVSELTLLRWEFVMTGRHGERLTRLGVHKYARENA